MRKLILVVCLSVISVAAGLADDAEYVEGEVLIEFAEDVDVDSITPDSFGYESLDDLAELFGVYELEPVFDLPTEPIAHPKGLWTWADWCDMVDECRLEYWFVLRYAVDEDPQSVADAYHVDPHTIDAGVNGLGELSAVPNDPAFSQGYQWNLYYPQNRDTDIHAPEGWEHHPFNWALAPMIIGLPDTGVWAAVPGNYNTVHEDLRANVIPGADAYWGTWPQDLVGHGTKVAGIFAAHTNNSKGIAGVAWNDMVFMPIRLTVSNIIQAEKAAKAIVWAFRNGADILNMSWGFYYAYPVVAKAIEGAFYLNVSCVAAKGNYRGSKFDYPADAGDSRMITAAGSRRKTSQGYLWWEGSNEWYNTIEVIAPCANPNIASTSLNNKYVFCAPGCSLAAAHVTGIASGVRHILELGGFGNQIDEKVASGVKAGGAQWPSGYYDPYREGWGTIYYNKSLNWAWNQVDVAESRPDRRVAAGDNGAAVPFSIAQNFPNPATSNTVFGFSLPSENAAAVLTVYDLSGRKIRAFELPRKGGTGELNWDLTDTAGMPVPAGVYVYRLTAGEEEAAKKLIVTR